MRDTAAAAECDARTIKESRGQREERLLGNSLTRSRQLQPDRQTYGGIQLMDGDWEKGALLMMTTGGAAADEGRCWARQSLTPWGQNGMK